FDTTITVFKNRRIDFLMDKLVPKKLKSTYLESVYPYGNKHSLAPRIDLIHQDLPDSYKGFKDNNWNTFAGLYGHTSIYGQDAIESVEVDHGNINIFREDFNVHVVASDIIDTDNTTVVSEGPDDTTLETEELIFHTRMNGPSVITTVTRKP